MLADRIIEPTTLPWSSEIMMATKQQDAYRFCIDFHCLNAQTVKAPQCLPRIHEILKDLEKTRKFTTLDLKSSYWQILMTPKARRHTAFSTPYGGQYQFRVMLFGSKAAPETLQNLMRYVLLDNRSISVSPTSMTSSFIPAPSWNIHVTWASILGTCNSLMEYSPH